MLLSAANGVLFQSGNASRTLMPFCVCRKRRPRRPLPYSLVRGHDLMIGSAPTSIKPTRFTTPDLS
ncbi:hypothetical protein M3J07_012889 [Ascochyta lentis]